MEQAIKIKTDNLHIRRSIQKIEESIQELEKTKSVLVSMLPKKKVDVATLRVRLPGGKIINALGKEVKDGNRV